MALALASELGLSAEELDSIDFLDLIFRIEAAAREYRPPSKPAAP
jgi:hypothetical protein